MKSNIQHSNADGCDGCVCIRDNDNKIVEHLNFYEAEKFAEELLFQIDTVRHAGEHGADDYMRKKEEA